MSAKTHSQCFQTESILVAACAAGGFEGYNEMVRFKVGAMPLNTSTLSVNWPSNTWQGLIQNAVTASQVAVLNTQVVAAGGCAQILEPVGGQLPANAKVILITSQNFNVGANIFGAITENIYVLFQNNSTAAGQGGHFGNYSATPGTRTLSILFGTCTDTVTYERSLLVDTIGSPGSAPGATVGFTPAGVASYTNLGCVAPVEVFAVDAGTTPITACPGAVISLIGSAQGQQSVSWTAVGGTYSTPTTLATNYTLPFSATGTITLTLTATNSCGTAISDNVTINVNSGVTPTFNAVSPICSGSSLAALPLLSNNGITGSWSPALNNNATTTYTFTPNAAQCAIATTLAIAVNTSTVPNFTTVAPICSGDFLSPLPTTSINGILGIWSPALNNNATTTYTFLPNVNQCATSTSITVTVNPIITPTFNAITPICSGTTLSPLPTISLNGISGLWSPTFNNMATTNYVFTPSSTNCVSSTSLTIVVNSSNTIPTFNAIAPICSGANLLPLPTTSLNGISGSWSPALDNNLTTLYTFTPSVGQCASQKTITITVNPSVIPTFNAVSPICEGSVLLALPTTSTNAITGTWLPALNNLATTTYTFTPNTGQCSSATSLTIVVNPKTTPTFNSVLAICAGGGLSPLPITSINGITGNWSPALNNMATTLYTFIPNNGQCANPTQLTVVINPIVTPTFASVSAICTGQSLNPLPTTSSNGILGVWSPALNNMVTTTYTFTPLAGQCATTKILTINVNNINTIPTFNAVAPICTGGFLSVLPTTSTNGITGTWSPALNNMVTTTYTFAPNSGQCATATTLAITVNPATITPIFSPIATICSGTLLPPLPTTSTNGIIGVWTPVLNNLATTTYNFIPSVGQCATNTALTVVVNNNIIPNFPTSLELCNGNAAPALNPISGNGILGTWQPSIINNAVDGVYVFTPNSGQCASSIALTVNISDNTTKNGKYYLCLDAAGQVISPLTIDTGLSALQYNFSWTLAGNTISNATSYQTSIAGIYTVVATNINTGCTITIIAEVIESLPAQANAVVNNDFEAQQQIVITVTGGLGDYQYQLDYGLFQSSTVFAVSQGGEHTINILDNLGCNNFELKVTVLNYPKFFTPNADGYHDTWNIEGLLKSQNGTLYIFDRYGKLLKELSTAGAGWDGTYNGIALPSSDYWFKLRYQNSFGTNKEYTNHFTLKR